MDVLDAMDAVQGTAVLFNEHLPELAGSLSRSLQEHLAFKDELLCPADGSVSSELLREAKEQALEEPEKMLEIYRSYSDYLVLCPQAVLQATGAKLEELLTHLLLSCSEELVHACRASTPFMFDVFLYYMLLKYGLIDAYNHAGNVTADEVYRGWPVEQQERRFWSKFGALWRVIWPARDYCACVEAYDYYTTMHALFDTLQLGRPDLHSRLLRPGSEIRRMVEAASHCEEWLEKDFQRIFSSYAKHSACLPGALMENIICLQRWLLAGKVVGSLNTAEMMVKLLALSDTCLEDTRWPFTTADVQYNFVRLANNWRRGNVGCHAMNRFGQTLEDGGCPEKMEKEALKQLLWRPSPLQQLGTQVKCTYDFKDACVMDGEVQVQRGSGAPFEVETCSETGRNRRSGVFLVAFLCFSLLF